MDFTLTSDQHGGIGYTTERHVERYLLDARHLTIAGGPNEGHEDASLTRCTRHPRSADAASQSRRE